MATINPNFKVKNLLEVTGTGTSTVAGGLTVAGTVTPGLVKGASNLTLQPSPGGNIQLDGGAGVALLTTATSGFITIPTTTGTPTGVPVNVPTGSLPIVFDTTANKLWMYSASGSSMDSNFGYVVSLLHFDGANNATTFTDQKGLSWTATGDAKLSTTAAKFGSTSLSLDGTGDYITLTTNGPEFDLGAMTSASAMTWEAHIRWNVVNGTQRVIFMHALPGSGGTARGGWEIYEQTGRLYVSVSQNYTVANTVPGWFCRWALNTGSEVVANTWYHIAVVFVSGQIKIFIDGVEKAGAWVSGTNFGSSTNGMLTTRTDQPARLGASGGTDANNPSVYAFFNGYIDELRWTKGAARYTSNFTAPTSAYPDAAAGVGWTTTNLTGPVVSDPTFTGTTSFTGSTVIGLTKTTVGLDQVDNTSDAAKPVSTAQLSALNLKADKASPAFTGTVTGITAAMVGLGNVTNTSDAAKPVSTAQQTALDLKADKASPTFTGTVSGITAAMVGLGNVTNTSDANKPVSTAQQTALDLKADKANPTFTGTVSGITATMVGLGNVDNTSDANKPVSTAQAAAIALKIGDAPSDGQNYVRKNAAWTPASVGVAGTDKQVQFNDGGALAGNSGFTFDKATGALSLTSVKMQNIGSGSFFLTHQYNDTASAGTVLTWKLNNASRVLTIGGDLTLGAAFTTTGGGITLTATGSTNVTLPTTGTLATLTDVAAKVSTSLVGAANGVASLDSGGKVPTAQLPSYVDDVLEAANLAAFPGTGETGKIYVALDTNKPYRWTGSVYVEITASPGSTDAVTEGSTNKYFTESRVLGTILAGLSTATNAVITAGDSVLSAFGKLQKQFSDHFSNTSNPHSVTAAQVGLGNVNNTSDVNKPVSTAQTAAFAPQVNPTFTGTVTIPTASPGTNDTTAASTAYVLSAAVAARGGGSDKIFFENDITVNNDYTVTTNKNAMSAGPITIASGKTVTIPSGSTWTIV